MRRPKGQDEILRLLTLIPFLNQRNGRPVREIAAELGRSRAELMDDLQRLTMYGYYPYDPGNLIMAVVDDAGRLQLTAAEQFRSTAHLTAAEVAVLRVALMPFADMERYGSAVRSIVGKLEAALLPKERAAFERLDRRTLVRKADRSSREVLQTMSEARKNLRLVEMLYFSGSTEELKRRVIEPYGFVLFGGSWYVVAKCRLAGEIRIFKADRIREIKLLDKGYKVPRRFNTAKFVENGQLFRPIGRVEEVVIWFSPKVAPYILERNANANKNKDGSAVLTVRAKSFEWIARWVTQYGKEVKILRPKEAIIPMNQIIESNE